MSPDVKDRPAQRCGARSLVRVLSGVLSVLLGCFWIVAGCTKLFGTLVTPDATQPVDWASEFPTWAIVLVSVFEIAVGWALWLGVGVRALLAGLTAVAGFSLLLVLFPPRPGQACGCGLPAAIETFAPLARNALLAAVHALAVACTIKIESIQPPEPGRY